MKTAILTIGDELCIGQIINTNAAWMAEQSMLAGANVIYHSVTGDDEQSILGELQRLSQDCQLVLITGGLGPTHDDITKTVLCTYFNDTLQLHQPTLNILQERYALRGIQLSDRNSAQAMLPSTCTVLPNAKGTAPGMLFKTEHCIYVSMPGVPAEMKFLMQEYILPLIRSENAGSGKSAMYYKTLLTTGIAESDLADKIGSPKAFLQSGQSLAFLPSYHGVRLRIGVQSTDVAKAEQEIHRIESELQAKAGRFIFGEGNDTLAGAVMALLLEKQYTIGVVESCTGGKLASALSDIPGCSASYLGGLLTYSNELKIALAGVDPAIISEYGAVSSQTATALAIGGKKVLGTDFNISITGIAGPAGGTEQKPVGTVWIGIAGPDDQVQTHHFIFGSDRNMNRERSVGAALGLLYKILKNLDS
jgi:nicotinamide-nucleotide amidase